MYLTSNQALKPASYLSYIERENWDKISNFEEKSCQVLDKTIKFSKFDERLEEKIESVAQNTLVNKTKAQIITQAISEREAQIEAKELGKYDFYVQKDLFSNAVHIYAAGDKTFAPLVSFNGANSNSHNTAKKYLAKNKVNLFNFL